MEADGRRWTQIGGGESEAFDNGFSFLRIFWKIVLWGGFKNQLFEYFQKKILTQINNLL